MHLGVHFQADHLPQDSSNVTKQWKGLIAKSYLQENKIIPNWHLGEQDDKVPEGIYLPKEVIDKKQDVCLNNSFAFGGSNVVLLMGKYNESLSQ